MIEPNLGISEIIQLGESLMQKHITEPGWKFELQKMKNKMGVCYYNKKVIALSTYHIICPSAGKLSEITDTILHEIAHAITPRTYPSHGEIWKTNAIKVGLINPQPCGYMSLPRETYKWEHVCRVCGKKWFLRRIPSRNRVSFCPDCKLPLDLEKIR